MEDMSVNWNPWHGCRKISPGCQHCFVYRQDEYYGSAADTSQCRKTGGFDLPMKRKRDKSWKIPSGTIVFTCFTSDFLIEEADEWRDDCWEMIRNRPDCWFYFFTKRIDRLEKCLPDDWGEGYDNVLVGCTVENQAMADYRLPIFSALPIKHKSIIVAPILGPIQMAKYLDDSIEEVSVGGESGMDARVCDYDWVLDIRRQCEERGVPFRFHQTGANFRKEGKTYRIQRRYQHSQARKAGIDIGIGDRYIPERADISGSLDCDEQLSIL